MRSERESGLIPSLPYAGLRRVLRGGWGRIEAWRNYPIRVPEGGVLHGVGRLKDRFGVLA